MIYSERQYKILEAEIQKLKKGNELTKKENKLLKKQNKKKDEIIQDLDKYNYRGQCKNLKLENEELKKKSRHTKKNSSLRESAKKKTVVIVVNHLLPTVTKKLYKIIV